MIELRDPASGLYSAPDWKPGKGGLFAVVIGVSAYPHLRGGSDPARETYGLGQLAASALTAYRFFQWLRTAYSYDDAPLVSCRLLLAPSDAEAALLASESPGAPKVGELSALPTLDNCRTAIGAWRDDMLSLDADTGAKSRALFFFSGHGIEASGRSLLLPMDWLGRSAPTPNDAISPQNLIDGLAGVSIPQQWFLCDACRSSTFQLNQLRRLEGIQVLSETLGDAFARSYPVWYASAGGMQAYGPADPKDGCTFFGGALIDGLYAKDASVVNRQQKPFAVDYTRLQQFVSSEAKKRLKTAGVNALAGMAAVGQYLPDNPATITFLSEPYNFKVETRAIRGPAPEPRSASSGASAAFLRDAPVPDVERELDGDLTYFADHPFGSERLTAFVTEAKLFHFQQDGTFAATDDGRGGPMIERVIRSAEFDRLEVTFSVESGTGDVWLEFEDSQNYGGDGSSFGISVPRGSPRFVLVLEADANAKVVGLSLYPKASEEEKGDAADSDLHGLYRLYRTLSAVEAMRRVERDIEALYDALLEKGNDPLKALEAALILLRSGRFGLLYGPDPSRPDDWLANLAEFFDPAADASVLVAQRLVSDPDGARVDTARALRIVAGIAGRRLPRTAEGLSYLLNLVRPAGRRTVIGRLAGLEEELIKLKAVVAASRVSEAMVETSGLFAVFGATVDPESRAAFESVKAAYLRTITQR